MTHLPYVLSCYALAVVVPVVLAATAASRLRVVRRRLAALDPRG